MKGAACPSHQLPTSVPSAPSSPYASLLPSAPPLPHIASFHPLSCNLLEPLFHPVRLWCIRPRRTTFVFSIPSLSVLCFFISLFQVFVLSVSFSFPEMCFPFVDYASLLLLFSSTADRETGASVSGSKEEEEKT